MLPSIRDVTDLLLLWILEQFYRIILDFIDLACSCIAQYLARTLESRLQLNPTSPRLLWLSSLEEPQTTGNYVKTGCRKKLLACRIVWINSVFTHDIPRARIERIALKGSAGTISRTVLTIIVSLFWHTRFQIQMHFT